MPRAVTKTHTALEFDNVAFRYGDSAEAALEDVNFKLERGQSIGIIGGTGSGKSTLVNLIPRFYDATVGEVKIFGKNVRDYKYSALHKMIGYVPQKASLISGTIGNKYEVA